MRTAGLRLGAEAALYERFSLGLSAGGYPLAREGDHKQITTQLIRENAITPDISRIRARASAEARVWMLRQTVGDHRRRLGVHAGLGMVYTVDDEEALMAEGDPAFEETARQVHPTTLLGLSAEVWWGPRGLRLRYEQSPYNEVVMSDIHESKRPMWIGAEAMWALP